MPTTRKPKKAFIQFAIAGVVSLVLGIGAIAMTLNLVSNVANNAEQEKQQAFAEAQKAKTELDKIKKSSLASANLQREVQAIADIPAGTILRESMITEIPMEPDLRTPGSFYQIRELLGRMTSADIKTGQIITKAQIVDSGGGLPVKEGNRAISIQIDSVGGLNGAISPGAFVDVITILPDGDEKITKTLLQNIEVIAVGANDAPQQGQLPGFAPRPKSGISSVTLSVTPKQAELLALANSQGKFHLTLRNDKDKETVPIELAHVRQLINGGSEQKPIKFLKLPPPPKLHTRSPNIPVQFSAGNYPDEGLPSPAQPYVQKRAFTMTIYKGSSSEEKNFQVDE